LDGRIWLVAFSRRQTVETVMMRDVNEQWCGNDLDWHVAGVQFD